MSNSRQESADNPGGTPILDPAAFKGPKLRRVKSVVSKLPRLPNPEFPQLPLPAKV